MRNQHDSVWTPELEKQLIKLWKNGLSRHEIAKVMIGFTPNAIQGKVHRLQRSGRLDRRYIPSPKPVTDKNEEVHQQPSLPSFKLTDNNVVSAEELSELEALFYPKPRVAKVCQWPYGEPGNSDYHICGEPVSGNNSFCKTHKLQAVEKDSVAAA